MESFFEKVARLQREIAERQAELTMLICGDSHKAVAMDTADHSNVVTIRPGMKISAPGTQLDGMEIVQILPTVTPPGSRGPYEGSGNWPE